MKHAYWVKEEQLVHEQASADVSSMPGYVRVAKTDENSTDSLLAERGKTHGDYHEQAELAGALRDLFATAGKWNKLTRVEKDAVLMIAVKLSRALTGNPHEGDHWKDIQGYARLVEKDLEFYGSPKAQPE